MSDQTQILNKSRVYQFLENLATSSSETTDIEGEIIQLKIKKKRLIENRKFNSQ